MKIFDSDLYEKHINKLIKNGNWKSLSSNQFLTKEFLIANKDKLHWDIIFNNKKYDISFIEEMLPVFSKYKTHYPLSIWEILCEKQILTEDFIRSNKDNVVWYAISQYQELSFEFIKEFREKIKFDKLDSTKFNIEFIREFKDNIDWKCINYNKFTQSMIIEFKNYIDWDSLSRKKLPLNILRKFKDKICWEIQQEYLISSISNSSISKFLEFKDKIKFNLSFIRYNCNFFTEDVLKYIQDIFQESWYVYILHNLSIEYILNNENITSDCINNWLCQSQANANNIPYLQEFIKKYEINFNQVVSKQRLEIDTIKAFMPYLNFETFKYGSNNWRYSDLYLKEIKQLFDQYGELT